MRPNVAQLTMSNGAPASSSPSFAIGDPLDLASSKNPCGDTRRAGKRQRRGGRALDLAELAEPSVTTRMRPADAFGELHLGVLALAVGRVAKEQGRRRSPVMGPLVAQMDHCRMSWRAA